MENEIIISDNNSVTSYGVEMSPEIFFNSNDLGWSADEDSTTLPAGVTVSGNGITVDNSFGRDVMLDGTGDVQFNDRANYVTVNAAQTNYDMRIYGNDKNNVIRGGNGENTLWGGESGNNSLTGGSTRDYFMYNGLGRTVITDFRAGNSNRSDVILFTDYAASASDVDITRSGSTVRMRFGENSNYVSLIGAGSEDSIIQYAIGSTRDVQYAKIGRDTLTYDDEVSYFKTNANGTININGDNSVNVWVDNSHKKVFENIANLNAGNSNGNNTLVGNNNSSTSITGGNGNSSLWGGYGDVSDTLIGGNGSEMFWYGRFDGNDIVQKAASNDTVFLYNSILDHIKSFSVNASEITLGFDSNSSLTVNSTDGNSATFMLADHSKWQYSFSSGEWHQS